MPDNVSYNVSYKSLSNSISLRKLEFLLEFLLLYFLYLYIFLAILRKSDIKSGIRILRYGDLNSSKAGDDLVRSLDFL